MRFTAASSVIRRVCRGSGRRTRSINDWRFASKTRQTLHSTKTQTINHPAVHPGRGVGHFEVFSAGSSADVSREELVARVFAARLPLIAAFQDVPLLIDRELGPLADFVHRAPAAA